MINKLASMFIPTYQERSPSSATPGKPDEADGRKEDPKLGASRRAMRKYKEKYKYRTMGEQLETQFGSSSASPSTQAKEPRQHLTP